MVHQTFLWYISVLSFSLLGFSSVGFAQASPTSSQDEVQKLKDQLKAEQEARKKAEKKSEALSQDLKDAKSDAKASVEQAKKEANEKLQQGLNRFKYLNVGFGILPNEDNDINNYSQISINYSPTLQTSLTYYSRTTSENKKSTTETPSEVFTLTSEREESSATKRMDINFDLIKYAPGIIKSGSAQYELSMAIGAYYSDSLRETNYNVKNSYIDPTTKKPKNIPASGQETESLKSLLPQIVADFKYQAPWAKARLAAGIVFLSRDKKQFTNKGSILTPSEAPDPRSNTPYKESVYNEYQFDTGNSATASGFKAGGELEYRSSKFGAYGLHFDYLEKFGDTKAFSVEPNVEKGTQDVVISEVYEERSTMQVAFSHSMDYLGFLGVIPSLRVNSNTDWLIKTPKRGNRTENKTSSYDFGVIFKY